MQGCIGTRNRLIPFARNAKQAGQYRCCSRGDERILVKTYGNGEKVRESIVRGRRKKRYPDRPYWHWTLDKTKKKRF